MKEMRTVDLPILKIMFTALASFIPSITRQWKPIFQQCLGHILVTLFTARHTFWSIWLYIFLDSRVQELCAGVFSPAQRGCGTGFWGPLLPLVSLILEFMGLAGGAGSVFPLAGVWEVGQLEKLMWKCSLDWQGMSVCFLNNLFACGAPREVKFGMNHSSWVLSDFEVARYLLYRSSETGDSQVPACSFFQWHRWH